MSDNRPGKSTSSCSAKADPPSPHDDGLTSVVLPEVQVQLHVHTNRMVPSQGRLSTAGMHGEINGMTTDRTNNHSLQISSTQLAAAIPFRSRGTEHNHSVRLLIFLGAKCGRGNDRTSSKTTQSCVINCNNLSLTNFFFILLAACH